MRRAVLPLLVAWAQAAVFKSVSDQRTKLHEKSARVSPELEPESDKKFFDKDYPADQRPAADKHYVFDHPYPAVQDSNDYDRDYIKDENSDGGKWQAQMDYDTLRSKITAEKEKLKDLKEKMEKEYEEWMKAQQKAKDAAKEVDEAETAVGKAKAAADAAEKQVNDLEGHSQKEGTHVGGAVGDAVKKVEDEMDDLEKCKKALEEAKRKLKKLLKEKEEYEKKLKEQQEAAEKAAQEQKEKEEAEKKAEEEQKKKEEEEKAAKKASGIEDEDDWDEEAWQKKLEKEKAQFAEASKTYEEELADVRKTEDDLARAAETLRKYRRPPYVDDDGGVYHRGKSNAFSAHMSVATIAVLVTFFA